jgi:hypothetical protein
MVAGYSEGDSGIGTAAAELAGQVALKAAADEPGTWFRATVQAYRPIQGEGAYDHKSCHSWPPFCDDPDGLP